MDRYLGAHYLWAPLSEQPKPDHGIWGVCIRVVCSPYSILGQVTPLISFFSQRSAAPNMAGDNLLWTSNFQYPVTSFHLSETGTESTQLMKSWAQEQSYLKQFWFLLNI